MGHIWKTFQNEAHPKSVSPFLVGLLGWAWLKKHADTILKPFSNQAHPKNKLLLALIHLLFCLAFSKEETQKFFKSQACVKMILPMEGKKSRRDQIEILLLRQTEESYFCEHPFLSFLKSSVFSYKVSRQPFFQYADSINFRRKIWVPREPWCFHFLEEFILQ